jgi:hypothetical protein
MDTGAECQIQVAEFLAQAKREPEREAHLINGRILASPCDQRSADTSLTDHARPIIPRTPNLDVR